MCSRENLHFRSEKGATRSYLNSAASIQTNQSLLKLNTAGMSVDPRRLEEDVLMTDVDKQWSNVDCLKNYFSLVSSIILEECFYFNYIFSFYLL